MDPKAAALTPSIQNSREKIKTAPRHINTVAIKIPEPKVTGKLNRIFALLLQLEPSASDAKWFAKWV
jgi:hypothetical protein